MGKFTIALDFDGTCVEHRYPYIGKELPNCIDTLKEWIKKYDVGIILYTMRDGKLLEDAIKWFEARGITLYGVNEHPTQKEWTQSPKCHANICIDDRNLGSPLVMDSENERPCINWKKVKPMVDLILKD